MSKKETNQEPEELQVVETALSKTENFLENHLKELIIAVLVVMAVFIGFFLFKYKYLTARELKAQEQIYKGENYFAQDSFALAINGDGVGYIGFANIAKEYKMTKTAKLAKVYMGISYARLNEPQKAIESLKDFDADDKLVNPVVVGLVGDCYVSLKEYDKALTYFKKAADKADNDFLTPIYYKKAAGVCAFQGKDDEALELLTSIKEKYPNSSAAYDIDRDIEALKAK